MKRSLGFTSIISIILTVIFLLGSFAAALAETDVTDKIQLEKSRLRYDRRTGNNYTDVALHNISADLLRYPLKVIIESISSPNVTVANADGLTADGKPYFLYTSDQSDLGQDQSTDIKRWVFHNPRRRRFSFVHTVMESSSSGNHLPVANAGDDQTVHVGDTVTLNGSGSTDEDGDALTFSWQLFKPEESTAQLSDPTAVSPHFHVDFPGIYTGELVVNDGQADSPADQVQISTENSPPQAHITVFPEGIIQVGTEIEFDGSTSFDVDGDILTYTWTLVARPEGSAADLQDVPAQPEVKTLVPDAAGDYVVQLIVSDGQYDSDPAQVTVSTFNNRPIAVITGGPEEAVSIGTEVNLDGSNSYDPDTDPIVSYTWALTVSPLNSIAELTINGAECQLTPDKAGDYVVQLMVSDGYDSSDPATAAVAVLANVPDVIGLPRADAETQIVEAGLVTGDVVEAHHATVPAGIVFDQAPSSGEQVDAGTEVDLWISLGPENIEVPSVVGMTQANAQAAIESAGLSVGNVTEENSETVPAGNVTSQNPAAGTSVAPGTAVNLVVSSGPSTVTVPDVVGMAQAAAETAITGAGLTVGSVTTAHSDTVPSGNVTSQNPAAGASAAPGSAVNIVVSTGPEELPPDPSEVAPSVDPTVPTSLFEETKFLYTGTNPIQTGVSQGVISSRRAAVLRGRVISRDGSPLSGAAVTIAGHSEYGQTLTRADGMFDLVVNGGGTITVVYTKDGYLTAYRSLDVPWRDFVHVSDVALIARDTQVTAVDLTSSDPVQVARGSVANDSDGDRQATLFFFQGTSAQMVMPDGSSSPVSTLNVRATEYTVGPNGPAAMPAELPPTSGYTYAVELSIDEAIAAGAQQVTFSQPVSFYVENFIHMPVGTKVPTAYYDADRAAWVPVHDGRVIKIVSITGNLADVDSTGDGQPDTAPGMTEAERQQLATTYDVGQELWRLRLDHFSIVDGNYGVTPPDTATAPEVDSPQGGRGDVQDDPNKQPGWGSADVENQVFSEQYQLVGTPFSLNYRSDSVEGYQSGNTIQIQLTGDTIPAELIRVDLSINIAGQLMVQHYPRTSLTTNMSVPFTWDGKDVYGRTLVGERTAWVRIDYIYPAYYLMPAPQDNSFGIPTGTLISSGILARGQEAKLSKFFRAMLGRRPAGDVGGWSIDAHHLYDPVEQVLYTGTGGRQSVVNSTINSLHRIAGERGNYGFTGDNGPAKNALLNSAGGMAVAGDGSIYFADIGNNRIRKISPDGMITTVAGDGTQGFSGDGGPATSARLYDPSDVAVGPDGSLYIADKDNNRIRRVLPDGTIITVAGNGSSGFGGDGGPAVSANLNYPQGVAVAPDGTLFIADRNNYCVRRVGPDGIITTYAGIAQNFGSDGDGGPATDAHLGYVEDVDVAPDGIVYIADFQGYLGNGRVRRVDPAGVITTVAGGGTGYGMMEPEKSGKAFAMAGRRAIRSMLSQLGSLLEPQPALAAAGGGGGGAGYNDGIPALDADLTYIKRVVFCDGALLITAEDKVYKVDGDGIISKIAGGGELDTLTEGMPGDRFLFDSELQGLAMGPDGRILMASETVVTALTGIFPGFDGAEKLIPSADGSLVYRFDPAGRHLQTLHSLTGAALLTFEYDGEGRLKSITDSNNHITTINRDANGAPTGITGPFGQTTTITVDADGYLKTLTNPADETVTMGYHATMAGLLTSVTGPRSNTYSFGYDSLGLLTSMTDPLSHTDSLTRTALANGHQVTLTTAMNRTTVYKVENAPSGDRTRTVVTPDGLVHQTVIYTDGSRKTTLPNGTEIDAVQGPDPRFGMLAPILASYTRTSPGGITTNRSLARQVVLSDPADILSVVSITDTRTVNGRTFTTVYDGATKTFTSTTAEGRTATREIDNQGRTVSAQSEDLTPASFAYNGSGFLTTVMRGTGAEARTGSFSYDAMGRLSTSTDAEGRVTSFGYDAADRVTSLTLPGSLALGYTYDASGNRASVTPPEGMTHAFAFNGLDLLHTYTAPDIGLPSQQTAYAYNNDRQLTTVTRPDGLQISNDFDAAGRLSTITIPTDSISRTFDANGRLSVISRAGATLAYGYDGSLLTSRTWSGPVSGTVGYTYNGDLQITSVAVNGMGASYTYDNDGLLMTAGGLNISRGNPGNHLVTGTSLGNVSHSFGYSVFGELASKHAAYSGTSIYDCQYTRDKLGRITQKVETIGGSATTYGYTYDAAGRLTGVSHNGTPVSSFTYDGNGNRLTSGSTNATYDDQDRLTQYGTTAYAYTDHGELASKTNGSAVTTYNYDVLGNLLSVTLPDNTEIAYVVDGTGRRIAKKKSGSVVQKFLYAGPVSPVAELDAGDNVVSRFVYGLQSNTPEYMVKGSQTYRIITDHLGSVRLVVDTATGAIAQQMDYDVFGNVLTDTSPGFQPFGFAGGLYDADTGLVRFGARDYDPEVGRWTAKDPLRFAGSPLNFYAYAGNDPVNFVDPLGLGPGGSLSENDYWDKLKTLMSGIVVPGIGLIDTSKIPAFTGFDKFFEPGSVNQITNLMRINKEIPKSYTMEVMEGGKKTVTRGIENATKKILETSESLSQGIEDVLGNISLFGVVLLGPVINEHPELVDPYYYQEHPEAAPTIIQ